MTLPSQVLLQNSCALLLQTTCHRLACFVSPAKLEHPIITSLIHHTPRDGGILNLSMQ